MHHAVALIRFDLHAAYRVNEFPPLYFIMLDVVFVLATMMAMDHVRSAAVAHHQIEKDGEQ
ncbi:MAG: hypothetical protein R8K46_10045 [Mariprofundaceae bacterium]